MPVDCCRTLGSALPQQLADFPRVLLSHALGVSTTTEQNLYEDDNTIYWWATADTREDVCRYRSWGVCTVCMYVLLFVTVVRTVEKHLFAVPCIFYGLNACIAVEEGRMTEEMADI